MQNFNDKFAARGVRMRWRRKPYSELVIERIPIESVPLPSSGAVPAPNSGGGGGGANTDANGNPVVVQGVLTTGEVPAGVVVVDTTASASASVGAGPTNVVQAEAEVVGVSSTPEQR